MFGQILKWAFLLLAVVGVVYVLLAATIGRARLLEIHFGSRIAAPTPASALPTRAKNARTAEKRSPK